MPLLRSLVRAVFQKAASDPQVREKAQKVFEDEIKPRAKDAWERARPEVEAARDKAVKGAASLADQLNRRIQHSAAERRAQRDKDASAGSG